MQKRKNIGERGLLIGLIASVIINAVRKSVMKIRGGRNGPYGWTSKDIQKPKNNEYIYRQIIYAKKGFSRNINLFFRPRCVRTSVLIMT